MDGLKGKKLLILGGMRISCEMIKKAQEMGLYVAVTDYNKPEDSPGKQIADAHYLVSTTDVDAVVDLIKKEHFDGVLVGFNDMLLPYYADICQKAELPCYGTREQFELFTDKEQYKALCRKFHVPTIAEYESEKLQNEEYSRKIQYPVIVKPNDSSGARGITICYNYEELVMAVNKAGAASSQGRILIEQYLDTREVTVFWLFQDGNYYVSTIGNRHVKHNQEGVIPLPAGYTFPASVTEQYLNEVAPKARELFRSVGVQNGMMFMQCKVLDGECQVYDVGYRLTGSLEYKILKETCDYDPLEMMIRFAVTGQIAEKSIADKVNPYLGQYAYNVSCLSAPGKIEKISGLEKVRNLPGVLDVVIAHPEGEAIAQNMKGLLAQITVRVLGISASMNELFKDIYQIQKQIRIVSDDGKDLMLAGIEESDLDGVIAEIKTRRGKNF